MAGRFPALYVILDAGAGGAAAVELAAKLASAGVELIQLRDKLASSRVLYEISRQLVERLRPFPARVIVNDRPDIAALAGAAGVHVGQEDLPVAAARGIVGAEKWVGVSTHGIDQVREAEGTSADYVAFGPIFPTTTKVAADPVVGVVRLRAAREETRKPLIAIGGITLERAEEVWRAGADTVAVSRDVSGATDPGARAREYLKLAAEVFGK